MNNFDVAIVGGGAAGLACAVRLVQISHFKIAVIEQNDRLAKKLSQTGNGQGNVSNEEMTVNHFFGGDKSIVKSVACSGVFTPDKIFGCLFTSDDKGRIYPAGKQASALGDCLIQRLKGRAEIIRARVTDVEKGIYLTLGNNQKIRADFAVLCVGGKAQKQFGTDGESYALARKLGHRITPLYPSLVQLKTDTQYIKTLKGIRVDCALSAFCGEKFIKKVRGDVIFTDYGISGNAAFAISPYCTDRQGVTLSVEFLPEISAKEIAKNLSARSHTTDFSELLCGTVHNQIARAIYARAYKEGLTKAQNIDRIVAMLKSFTLECTGTLGFDYAQVTRGGIEMRGVTEELESKYLKNLFFAGEVLDVDGDCGGYNLQWAFSSGYAVANSIYKKYGIPT